MEFYHSLSDKISLNKNKKLILDNLSSAMQCTACVCEREQAHACVCVGEKAGERTAGRNRERRKLEGSFA